MPDNAVIVSIQSHRVRPQVSSAAPSSAFQLRCEYFVIDVRSEERMSAFVHSLDLASMSSSMSSSTRVLF